MEYHTSLNNILLTQNPSDAQAVVGDTVAACFELMPKNSGSYQWFTGKVSKVSDSAVQVSFSDSTLSYNTKDRVLDVKEVLASEPRGDAVIRKWILLSTKTTDGPSAKKRLARKFDFEEGECGHDSGDDSDHASPATDGMKTHAEFKMKEICGLLDTKLSNDLTILGKAVKDEIHAAMGAHLQKLKLGFYDVNNKQWHVHWDKLLPDDRVSMDFTVPEFTLKLSDGLLADLNEANVTAKFKTFRFRRWGGNRVGGARNYTIQPSFLLTHTDDKGKKLYVHFWEKAKSGKVVDSEPFDFVSVKALE